MSIQANISNINSPTYPVDVYVCEDCNNINCTQVDTINSVPATITIPEPYSGYSSFSIKLTDSVNCEYCKTFSGTTTTTSTTINPLCLSCDLGFDFYDTNPISEISVGLVTASCDPSITDYVIEWYGPGIGSTNISFTSGYGSDYLGDYLYTHPLTGTSSVPVVAGVYTPILQKIKINGTEYTDLNCFSSTTVDVDAFTCDNGQGSDNANYSHKLEFNAIVNQTPQPVTTTFVLDQTKPYFAFRFEGETIFDTLEITYYGSSYSDPIIIENISQGVNLDETNFSLSLIPKKLKTLFTTNLSKVLNLTNFTITPGDYLEIKIIPNPDNNNTNWKLYCECLETFNCETCYDSNTTQPFKIIESTISALAPTPCGDVEISFKLSGCSDSDFYRYMLPNEGDSGADGTFYTSLYYSFTPLLPPLSNGIINPNIRFSCDNSIGFLDSFCEAPSTSNITYFKTVSGGVGLITITFDDYTDLEAYYNDWQTKKAAYSGSSNCNDYDYYRFLVLRIPLAQGSEECGDTTGYKTYNIHPSAIVTSGGTGPWTMSINMSTISNCLTFDSCDINCIGLVNGIVSAINSDSTGTTNNISFTTNTGSRLVKPFDKLVVFVAGDNTMSATTFTQPYIYIPKYINQTIPYSGSPLTVIPSLSAETCNLNNWTPLEFFTSKNLSVYLFIGAYYEVRAVNPLNPEDFEIWAPTLVNGTWAGYPFPPTLNKIYGYIGGTATIYDPTFFV